MKNNRFTLLLSMIMLFVFSSGYAQTYTSGNITAVAYPSMSHDSTTCNSTLIVNYTITIDSSFVGDSMMVVEPSGGTLLYSEINTAGTTPWVINVPLINLVYDDMNVPVGGGTFTFYGNSLKIVSGPDTVHCDNLYPFTVTNPCSYGDVSGIVYADNNNDCVYNTGDLLLVPNEVTGTSYLSSPTGSLQNNNLSWGSPGGYNMKLQQSWMTNCTVNLQPYYSFIFPPQSCATMIYNFTTLPQVNVDFPVQPTANVDVECWAGSTGNARPNRPFYMQPTVSNIGIDSISGVLTLVKDNRVAYNAALSAYPADIVHGDTLMWNYYNLTCLAGGAYWNYFMSSIHLTPDSSVNIGDTLCFHIYTGVPAADVNPANNDFMICLPVVNSYDPNIKEVSPMGVGATGDIPSTTPELTYTIHFQNTGTAPAIDVNVIDTLDGHLDALSLKILGTSHNMTPEWAAPGVVKFKFSNIYLADSFSNEPASHGYVRFKVKMHSGLAPGTQIKNKGYIYFDTNPAIITNEALNTIIHTADVPTVKQVIPVKIYPNPATDNIFVENLQDGNIVISNVNGAVVLDQIINNNKTEINISSLTPGIYIMKTICKDGTTTRKFVKE